VSAREVIAALRRAGFVEDRQTGSHLTLLHPESRRRVTVPKHPGDLRVGTLAAVVAQSGLSVDEFLEHLR